MHFRLVQVTIGPVNSTDNNTPVRIVPNKQKTKRPLVVGTQVDVCAHFRHTKELMV